MITVIAISNSALTMIRVTIGSVKPLLKLLATINLRVRKSRNTAINNRTLTLKMNKTLATCPDHRDRDAAADLCVVVVVVDAA